MITESQLKQIMPGCTTPAGWIEPLIEATNRFQIDNNARLAAFLAQIAVESRQLSRLVESLYYKAERLMEVWPARFPTLAIAQPYENQPQKLANFVYADRLGNGNSASGDGWTFRGRGIMQITGRSNYRDVAKNIGLPTLESQPDLLAQPPAAALSAAYFWKSKGLNEFADQQTDDSFRRITKIINGGDTGLSTRLKYWETAKSVLGA
jgi:putative chitinase